MDSEPNLLSVSPDDPITAKEFQQMLADAFKKFRIAGDGVQGSGKNWTIDPECCGEEGFACPESETLKAVFAGVLLFPIACSGASAPGATFIGTGVALDGLYTLTKVGDFWEVTLPGAYLFDYWIGGDCGEEFGDPPTHATADIKIVVYCGEDSGLEIENGLYVSVFTVNESSAVVSGLAFMSGGPFRLGEEFTPDYNPCGGTITVQRP